MLLNVSSNSGLNGTINGSKSFSNEDDEEPEEEEFSYDEQPSSSIPSPSTATSFVVNSFTPQKNNGGGKILHSKLNSDLKANLLRIPGEVERNFPSGAVKRAAEKAARSFQSTQPKVSYFF